MTTPLNGIAATRFHDEGAIAQCGYCERYTLDRKALADSRQPVCDCGKQHYWSGGFKKPGPDAQWFGPAPQPAQPADLAGFPVVLDDRIPPGEARIAQDGETVGRIVGIAQPAAQAVAPDVDDAYKMGAKGGPAVEAERLAFEAWMAGHCWALSATWTGTQYRSDDEASGDVNPHALRTRQLWAAWRDRAALAAAPAVAPPAVQPLTAAATDVLAERRRQIEAEGWTPEHDDEHGDGSLTLAAICYAAPKRLYEMREYAAGPAFLDPWPDSWDARWDKRRRCGERVSNPGNMPPDPATYTAAQRRDLLVKAGALILAEIERLDRAHGIGTLGGIGDSKGGDKE